MNHRDYLYDNWKQLLALNLPNTHPELKLFRNNLLRGNLKWMIRRLIGGVPSDSPENIERWIAEGRMLPKPEFTRMRHVDENIKHKNK